MSAHIVSAKNLRPGDRVGPEPLATVEKVRPIRAGGWTYIEVTYAGIDGTHMYDTWVTFLTHRQEVTA